VAHFKTENGLFYTGPAANGPWQVRELTESRSRPKPSRNKEKPMSKSGFERERWRKSAAGKRRGRGPGPVAVGAHTSPQLRIDLARLARKGGASTYHDPSAYAVFVDIFSVTSQIVSRLPSPVPDRGSPRGQLGGWLLGPPLGEEAH
jgi:hypothetical protein